MTGAEASRLNGIRCHRPFKSARDCVKLSTLMFLIVRKANSMIEKLHDAGIKSDYAYLGGFASIALSLTSWLVSRTRPADSKAQSDRWGIFVGHWAPTFFALGIALRLEEKK